MAGEAIFLEAPLFTFILSALIFLLAFRVLLVPPAPPPTPKFYPKKSLDAVRFFSSIELLY
jgi:hypothetical protein